MDDEYEPEVIFDEDNLCDCSHDAEQHTWDGCGIDECKCVASWVE